MALLGASLIIASLSICIFRWRPDNWLSWTRHFYGLKDEPPPGSVDLSRDQQNALTRDTRPEAVSLRLQDTPLKPQIAGSPMKHTQATTQPPITLDDTPQLSPTTPEASQYGQHADYINSGTSRDSSLTPSRLMPPPARPSKPEKASKPLPSSFSLKPPQGKPTTGSLRPPTLGPSHNRTSSLALNPRAGPTSTPTTSTFPAVNRGRKKVILAPGHSPLDWAHLTTTSPPTALSGVPALQRVTPSQLKTMNGRKGRASWSTYKGRVYNIGPYLPFHPGGEGELMRGAGKEAGKLFEEVHPWVNWEGMMSACVVGIMVGESETLAQGSEAEEMD